MVSAVPGTQAEAGLRDNLDVGLRCLEAWLGGDGAVGIHNLMEDAAAAEISRSQVWQWAHKNVRQVALADDFADFLTLPAYAMVD
jgi:malate synthase